MGVGGYNRNTATNYKLITATWHRNAQLSSLTERENHASGCIEEKSKRYYESLVLEKNLNANEGHKYLFTRGNQGQ